jgi:hypothetical protein
MDMDILKCNATIKVTEISLEKFIADGLSFEKFIATIKSTDKDMKKKSSLQ